jgi:hypothetical protein
MRVFFYFKIFTTRTIQKKEKVSSVITFELFFHLVLDRVEDDERC